LRAKAGKCSAVSDSNESSDIEETSLFTKGKQKGFWSIIGSFLMAYENAEPVAG